MPPIEEKMDNYFVANIAPPEPFNFSQPDYWSKWRKRFERYINVSGQSTKRDQEQIDLLFYIMGEKSKSRRLFCNLKIHQQPS